MDRGAKFRRVLDAYSRPDKTAWTGAAIERATRGDVSRYYVSKLRRGAIHKPGYDKLRLISEATGIPMEAWPAAENTR